MKSTPLLFACMASLSLAAAIGERQEGPERGSDDWWEEFFENEQRVITKLNTNAASTVTSPPVSTNTNAAPTATSQPEKSDWEWVKEHCDRWGGQRGKKERCYYAARQCTGRVFPTDGIDKYLGASTQSRPAPAFGSHKANVGSMQRTATRNRTCLLGTWTSFSNVPRLAFRSLRCTALNQRHKDTYVTFVRPKLAIFGDYRKGATIMWLILLHRSSM